MYILPQPYKCEKCGFEAEYSPHETWPAPVLDEGPTCPRCFADLIRKHCGIMKFARRDEQAK